MSNPLQQTIEALAKEKGIEPDVVQKEASESLLLSNNCTGGSLLMIFELISQATVILLYSCS